MAGGASRLARILADKVYRGQKPPNLAMLFRELRNASLATEEGRHVTCLLTCKSLRGRSRVVPGFTAVELNAATVVKLALATDPRTSSLRVRPDGNKWMIDGIVDRGIGDAQVGAFQVSIDGVGHLAIHAGGGKLAELVGDDIRVQAFDVLAHGPVHAQLGWTSNQIAAVKGLLLRIKGFGHGGAVVIHDNAPLEMNHSAGSSGHIDLKYRVTYKGLQTALASKVKKDIDRALWFVALLARVDGVVLLDRALIVRGFAGFLRVPASVGQVFVPGKTEGTYGHFAKVTSWGTRHQSVIAYCSAYPAAVGLVVSSDGATRAITYDEKRTRVSMWSGIRLGERDLPGA